MNDLSGDWALSDDSGAYACTMAMPTDGISALHAAGLIPDPYWGRNEYDLRWICERDWTATRGFDLTETDVDLVLSEVDTVVTVRVNDIIVLEAENAFRTYRVSLNGVGRVGSNTISVTFHNVVAAGSARQEAHPFDLPQSDNCPIPNGNMLRKPAFDFGWDWNIALAPFGIYGKMAIEPSAAPRIDRMAIVQEHGDGFVDVEITAYVNNWQGAVTATLAGQTVMADCVDGVCDFSIRIADPVLWWPVGQGDPHLYRLAVTVAKATATRLVGLRTMELVAETDSAGLGFKFRVNGRDVFCKGANWIPADALPGRITDAKTRALLQSAVDANMNMVRVWGGGRYEPDSFYDACDELGLMVWQDFMFACNLYPSDESYLANVRAEVADNVARIHHHACLAVWCGDNELIGALGWYACSIKDRDRYLVNYDRLNRTLEVALKDIDPTANWWPSSPSPGPMNFGDAWHDDGSGDMHFWSVWHEGRDFDHYRDVSPRFCSEFGFQSYPSMIEIERFAGPEDQNIAAPVLESHQKNAGGNARIAETMFRYFRWPEKFDDFVYLSQIQQGLAIKTAVTHWRSLKPHCMGTLIWQLNDTWPVCSWASLNHQGDWKLMHHMAQDFFAPLLVTAVPDDSGYMLRVVNDAPQPETVAISAYALAMDGRTRQIGQAEVMTDAASIDALHVAADQIGPQEMLHYVWRTADGQQTHDTFAPRPYKSYDLQSPQLLLRVEGNVIHVRSEGLAHFFAVEADIAGRFDQNVLTLLPETETTMCFTPADPDAAATFTFRDLHSATYR
ncbi:glycoside hydrolase family 2 protein [Yoonia sediminilitoris]|uniref:beta-mannosidase n=1 Tax=Yoonia sediminilitoris TaxID=1286148 RepID=A0A2T6KPH3_9RHOB|nr:glycoside hydrolase family 2 protein [Yoonia sediminilitoris]PUB18457.1 beta-mannosidase [Yoonia sediminilitoris]RCW98625.1 beta-mannosidase [Yoonia sediminilitoris]